MWFGRRTGGRSGDLTTTVRYRHPFRSRGCGRRVIRCLDGCAWVTVEGDIADEVLAPGQTAIVPAGRLALVTGMDECVVEISDAPRD
jgi:hypothetical protein